MPAAEEPSHFHREIIRSYGTAGGWSKPGLVKQPTEERAVSGAATTAAVTAMATVSSAVVIPRVIVRFLSGWIRLRVSILPAGRLAQAFLLCPAALDNLVELATIEPNATAFGAIVNFDALALAHDEIDLANRARQSTGLVSPDR